MGFLLKQLVIIAAAAALCAVLLCGCSGFLKKKDSPVSLDENKTYAVQDIKNINIDYYSADIAISSSSGGDISVSLSGTTSSNLKFSSANKDGTLAISESVKSKTTSITNNMAKLTVQIPKDVKLNYSIKLKAGDLSVKSLEIGSITVNQSAGDATADNCTLDKKSSIYVVAGNVNISGFDRASLEKLKINVLAGNKTIK